MPDSDLGTFSGGIHNPHQRILCYGDICNKDVGNILRPPSPPHAAGKIAGAKQVDTAASLFYFNSFSPSHRSVRVRFMVPLGDGLSEPARGSQKYLAVRAAWTVTEFAVLKCSGHLLLPTHLSHRHDSIITAPLTTNSSLNISARTRSTSRNVGRLVVKMMIADG